MSGSYVVDQLHDKDCFSYTGTTEQTDLTTLCIRANQVYDLDTSLQDLCSRHLLLIRRSRTMNGPAFLCFRSRLVIYRISKKIKYSSQAGISYRNCDRAAGIYCLRAPDKTIGRVHGNTPYDIITNLLCYFGRQLCAV